MTSMERIEVCLDMSLSPFLFQMSMSVLMDSISVTKMPIVQILMVHINVLVTLVLSGMEQYAKVYAQHSTSYRFLKLSDSCPIVVRLLFC